MKEKDFQTTFNHWVKEVYRQTACFELKLCKTNALPFSTIAPHQIEALLNAKHGVLVYKIPDCGFQNPFDCYCLANVPAFVVIKYPDFFCLIDVGVFVLEMKTSKRKSLTSERARLISFKVVC